ncbi:MAG: hypothetical protein QXL82_01845 [Candidatus Aenigmatarchaeota archaeon]
MSIEIIVIFALIYSVISSVINVIVERKKEVVKLVNEIEKYKEEDNPKKLLETYLKLSRITLKYTILNLIVGLIIFFVLWNLLKNLEILIPFLNISISWVLVYIFLTFVFVFVLKLLFNMIYKKFKKLK